MSSSPEASFSADSPALLPTYNKLPIALVRGEGCHVWDDQGNRYLDFYGGHCVALLGHCPPRVVAAIQRQAGELLFYSNVVHSPIRSLAAERLAALAPEGMGHIFFCNSGTEANETALKLARATTGKHGVIAMEGGFHGRTLGSLAVTHAWKYREPYDEVLPPTEFVPFGDAEAVEQVMTEHGDIGAVILEPIQSIAGMRVASAAYMQALRTLCDEHGAVLIFDEVQTGVGRTGTFSISEQLGMTPDVITLAKSLGTGAAVGAVLASDALAEQVEPGDHGSTFGGGMLAMAAVAATLETLVADGLMERAPLLFEQVKKAVAPHARSVRGLGALIGVELAEPAGPVLAALRERGVLAGGSGDPNVLRLMPPLVATDEDVAVFADVFAEAVETAAVSA